MSPRGLFPALAFLAALAIPVFPAMPVMAQSPVQPSGTAEQRAALDALDFLDGAWRGEARIGPQGNLVVIQTERVGDLLGGSVKLIEGRGHGPDGQVLFNAFGVVSWTPEDGYLFSTWTSGQHAAYAMTVTPGGFRWSHPAGPDGEMRYEATVRDGRWRQVGDYVAAGQPPVRSFEMELTRIGDTDWPLADPVAPRP
jgi:hypothetical protein